MNYGGPHRIFCPHPSSLSPQLSCLEAKFPSSAHCLAYIFFSSLTSLSEIQSSILWFCSFFWVFVLHFSLLLLRRGSPLDPLFLGFHPLCSLLFTPYSSSLRPLLSLHRGIAKLIVGFAFFLGFQNFYPLFLVSSPPHSIQWFSLFPAFHPLFSPIFYLASKLFRPISCKWILQCLFPKKDQNDASLHLEDESKKKFWKAWWNLSAQLQEWRVGG